MTSREEAGVILAKHGVSQAFLEVLIAEDAESRAAALAGVLAQDQGSAEPTERPVWFVGPVAWTDASSGRRVPTGVDVTIPIGGGRVRTFAGGRVHGPLSPAMVDALERAGYAGRLTHHPPGSDAYSTWEQSLPVESPASVREQLLGVPEGA
jgi:hypothetical protein